MSSIQPTPTIAPETIRVERPERPRTVRNVTNLVRTRHQWYLPVKAIMDFTGGLILLILTAPFTLLGVMLIKITSPGPAFYMQSRLGKNGRVFRVIKLRTMIHNAEATTGAVWSTEGDPRITKIGHILRKTHIDEFPQLINVLRGQMSLIGPRPERPEIAHKLAWEIENYDCRTFVRPGISGLAQLKLPPDTDLNSVRRKLACDLYYIKEVNPWLDLRLLFFTGWLFAKVFIQGVWRRIYIPDARMIKSEVGELFTDELDLAP